MPLAVVFDCDGLLVDTAHCWQAAYRETLRYHGRTLSEEELAQLTGASVRGAAEHLALPVDELTAALVVAFASARIEPLPGARLLLERLNGRARLAVATNAPGELATRALSSAGIVHHFVAIVSAETSRDKPAPDVYLAACEALGAEPRESVALEDSAVGVAAARSAGLVVVYVPSRPDASVDADLEIGRLDDPRLLNLLRLDTAAEVRNRARAAYSGIDPVQRNDGVDGSDSVGSSGKKPRTKGSP